MGRLFGLVAALAILFALVPAAGVEANSIEPHTWDSHQEWKAFETLPPPVDTWDPTVWMTASDAGLTGLKVVEFPCSGGNCGYQGVAGGGGPPSIPSGNGFKQVVTWDSYDPAASFFPGAPLCTPQVSQIEMRHAGVKPGKYAGWSDCVVVSIDGWSGLQGNLLANTANFESCGVTGNKHRSWVAGGDHAEGQRVCAEAGLTWHPTPPATLEAPTCGSALEGVLDPCYTVDLLLYGSSGTVADGVKIPVERVAYTPETVDPYEWDQNPLVYYDIDADPATYEGAVDSGTCPFNHILSEPGLEISGVFYGGLVDMSELGDPVDMHPTTGDLGHVPSGAIWVTARDLGAGGPLAQMTKDVFGTVVHGLIVFNINPGIDWDVSSSGQLAPCGTNHVIPNGLYDLQGTISHELGHVVAGIDDLCSDPGECSGNKTLHPPAACAGPGATETQAGYTMCSPWWRSDGDDTASRRYFSAEEQQWIVDKYTP